MSTASSFLARMAEASRERVRRAKRRESERALLARAGATAPPPPLALKDFDVIAELKLRSPAAGALTMDAFDWPKQVKAYADGGAAAVSVLTEPTEFQGELTHLEGAAKLLRPFGVPTMRKDFLTDPYQVLEARAAGAGGVLVILAMLDDGEVRALLDCAADCGLFVLLEAFDERDLARVQPLAELGPRVQLLVGVNSRDLRTLEVRFSRFEALRDCLPPSLPAVAESGVSSVRDIEQVARLGYRLALVGSALMQTSNPAGQVAALLNAGRACREATCS